MKTAVCDLLGVEFPILAFSHCRDVVAEVSKAGGFGVLGAVGHTPDQLDVDLGWIEDEVGAAPFGVDLIVPAKYAGDDQGGLTMDALKAMIPGGHQDFLAELLDRYAVPPLPEGGHGSSYAESMDDAPFSAKRADLQMDVAFGHRISLIANALGPPPATMIERAHGHGVKVAALAGSRVHAERHVNAGVDLIVAQGYEAGGHTGEIGSMVLIPEIVDAASSVPVLGAGGIGRGRQMAAAMALGAEGVWCGSVWLTTEEAETEPVVKAKMLEATSSDTERSRSLTGKPARMLRSAWTTEWNREDTPEPLGMPLQPVLAAQAQARIRRAAANHDGAAELSNYFVGQIVGTMNQPKSARAVVYDFIEEFITSVEGLARHLEM